MLEENKIRKTEIDLKNDRKKFWIRISSFSFIEKKKIIKYLNNKILNLYNSKQGKSYLHTLNYKHKFPGKNPIDMKDRILHIFRLLMVREAINELYNSKR
jgi:hypothetical protein